MTEASVDRANTPAQGLGAGLYVYCVVAAPGAGGIDEAGLDGAPVSLVAAGDLAAVTHACPPEPYQAEDPETVSAWVLAHHQVVEAAWRRYDTVLPMTFNTIVAGRDEAEALQNLRSWLAAERASLLTRLERFRDRAEYGVQVSWDPRVIGRQVIRGNQEMAEIEAKVRAASRGLAYMHRQRLERLLRAELEARAQAEARDLLRRVRQVAGDVHVGPTKPGEAGWQMLANLSCLLSPEGVPRLEAQLEDVRAREGFSVRLAGPFPPYSFC